MRLTVITRLRTTKRLSSVYAMRAWQPPLSVEANTVRMPVDECARQFFWLAV